MRGISFLLITVGTAPEKQVRYMSGDSP